MSSLLKSSLSLQDALTVCSEVSANKHDKVFCLTLVKEINNGNLLSSSLGKYASIFSALYISLIQIGENSGTLPEVFEKLSGYLQVKKETKEKIIQSLIYPLIVLFTTLVIVLIIIFYVFPRLQDIFDAFIESSHEIVENISHIKAGFMIMGILCAILCLVGYMLFVLHKKNKKIAEKIDSVFLRLPVLGKYILVTQMHDFSFAMKLLIATHFSFTESLKLSLHVCTNVKIKTALENVYKKVKLGKSIGKSFEEENVFPSYLVTWIKVAQTSGDVDSVFTQIYAYYSYENAHIISGIAVGAEPVFILLTGIIVIWVVSQFVIPIFKMMGSL
jgi:type IV pilus assembly protein PilC